MAWRVGSSKVSAPLSRSCGKTQVWRGTPAAVPKWREANCATPILLSHDAIGTDCFQWVILRPPPRSSSSWRRPLATTWYLTGAVTRNSLVALSEGWSIVGSHWRARVGQFQLKKVGAPNVLLAIPTPAPCE